MDTTELTTEEQLATDLQTALRLGVDQGELDLELDSVSSFDEAGVMTRNEGLVVRLGDGSEFQVTVVRSR